MSLFTELKERLSLGKSLQENLKEASSAGIQKFKNMNNERLEYAFACFSPEMKHAFFEALFFFHVNLPFYKRHKYQVTKVERISGKLEKVTTQHEASLYIEGAPHGIVGIAHLPEIIQTDFYNFIKETFYLDTLPAAEYNAIHSIASLGSIGTIGHKANSDLDLQIQYDLNAFLFTEDQLEDHRIKSYCTQLIEFYADELEENEVKKKRRHVLDLNNKKIKQQISTRAEEYIKKLFPEAYKAYLDQDAKFLSRVFGNVQHIQKLLNQTLELVTLYEKNILYEKNKELDRRLLNKAKLIESYLAKKYATAEIHFFVYPTYLYRQGIHGNTIETKESSGSAYERILNYELLLPGIQMNESVPLHYLFPDNIVSNAKSYETTTFYIRFQITTIYNAYLNQIVDLGHIEPLSSKYIIDHIGAMYWEAFKATSGNLPKAFLNLLRFEMLLLPKGNKSIIELIKDPSFYDNESSTNKVTVVNNNVESFLEGFNIEQDFGVRANMSPTLPAAQELSQNGNRGFSIRGMMEMETAFPYLLQDPWWLRYKALKIFYTTLYPSLSDKEKKALSFILDLCFALHVGISDVFSEPEEGFTTQREKQLSMFFQKAFQGAKRNKLMLMHSGSVDLLITFEKQLKILFKNAVHRVNRIAKGLQLSTQSNADEFRIWYYYYKQYFDPEPNIIQKGILNHLQVPRGKLQIAYSHKQKKWIFRALQKLGLSSETQKDKILDFLPDQVTLFEHSSFLHGLAHCIMNNYYGIYNPNTLYERHTSIEFSVSETKSEMADEWSFIRPDGVVRLVRYIYDIFPEQEYDYRDCIRKQREITEILICLNLLEYGRLSILYRDNLKVWRIDNFDHLAIKKNAAKYYHDQDLIFEEDTLFTTIIKFLEKQHFYIREDNINSIYFWVNVNSLRTTYSVGQYNKKEKALNDMFYKKFRERFLI